MRRRAHLRADRGFMLVELLLVLGMMVVIVGATFSLLELSTRAESRDQQFANAIADGQTAIARMTHEIRQAASVTATTPNSIDFVVVLAGQSLRVFYECDVPRPTTTYQECVRLSVAAGGALPALSSGQVVVPRITNGTLADPVFSFAPNGIVPVYADVKLKLPAAGELRAGVGLRHATVLDSGVYLRNLDLGA